MTRPSQSDTAAPERTIEVTINGVSRSVPLGSTIGDHLAGRGYKVTMVIVERNGVIIPRDECAQTSFEAGDVVEIVHAVGGG
jgi:sulfur carrier protein